jgi:hypothetical protein
MISQHRPEGCMCLGCPGEYARFQRIRGQAEYKREVREHAGTLRCRLEEVGTTPSILQLQIVPAPWSVMAMSESNEQTKVWQKPLNSCYQFSRCCCCCFIFVEIHWYRAFWAPFSALIFLCEYCSQTRFEFHEKNPKGLGMAGISLITREQEAMFFTGV